MGEGVGRDFGFIKTRLGIFKIVQFFLSLLTLIIVTATRHWNYVGYAPAAFVDFTGSFVCITLLISLFIYLCKLYNLPLVARLPWKMLEVGYGALCAILFFISMAICAWVSQKGHDTRDSFIAGAIFSALTMVIFALFTFFVFREEEIPSQNVST